MSQNKIPPFSRRLLELRELAGWSSYELATRAGLNPQTVRNLEKGKDNPSLATARALARALGTTIDDLDGQQ